MKKSKIITVKKNSWNQLLSKIAIFTSILMIVGGTIGMILIQKDLQKSQDLRQQASVDNGQVAVTMTSTDLGVDQAGKINFSINTSGVQTDGIQLTFNIVSNILPTPPVFTILDSAPIQLAYSEVEVTADGYLVSIIALPKQLGQSFAATTDTPFGSLDVTPSGTGTITLNFDVENSISTVHASNPPTDELSHIATSEFVVGDTPISCLTDSSGNPVCAQWQLAPDYCEGGTLIPGGTNDCGCSLPPSCENPEATPEVTPDPTDEPGLGGNPEIATCNESCSSNSDCDTNLRCYSGQCRLVTNVTSSTCSNPTDQGLSFACNEYCADTNECASGLTCYNNSCRNPENVNNTSCSNLTTAQRAGVTRSCNQSCSSNNDCDVNLRCYQGACRLATNPGSYSCSASTKKSISKSVYGTTATSKGGSSTSTGTKTQPSTTGKTDPNKVVSKVTIDSDKTSQKTADTDKMAKDAMENEEESALDVVKEYFLSNPKLPVILMGIGLGLITAIILLAFLKRKKDDDEPPTPPTGGTTGSGAVQQQNLQNRINSLKQESMQTQGNTTSVPPAMSAPVAQTNIPQDSPFKNTSGEVFSNQNKSSSMLDKIKNKDITPPSV